MRTVSFEERVVSQPGVARVLERSRPRPGRGSGSFVPFVAAAPRSQAAFYTQPLLQRTASSGGSLGEGTSPVLASGPLGVVSISRGNNLVPNGDPDPLVALQIQVFAELTTLSSRFFGNSHKPFDVFRAILLSSRCFGGIALAGFI